MDGRAFNPAHALGRRDVLRALAACLADFWLPRRVFALSYYIWLNAEKGLAYRKRTLYLFLAEGVDELLAIRSDLPGTGARLAGSATLADTCATMAHWLGVPLRDFPGRPIPSLAG